MLSRKKIQAHVPKISFFHISHCRFIHHKSKITQFEQPILQKYILWINVQMHPTMLMNQFQSQKHIPQQLILPLRVTPQSPIINLILQR